VLPSGDPGSEGRPVLAGELGAPVVEAAGGRVGRADLPVMDSATQPLNAATTSQPSVMDAGPP